jgi:hypothetical protein
MDWIREAKPPKSPRPHWITILLGLLSPCLALVSLYFSLNSLDISRTSLDNSTKSLQISAENLANAQRAAEIGQRAYLVGTFQLHGTSWEGGAQAVLLEGSFGISNLGNTTASDVEIIPRSDVSESKTELGEFGKDDLKDLGPRQSRTFRLKLLRKYSKSQEDSGDVGSLCIFIRYKDVFGYKQQSDDICG